MTKLFLFYSRCEADKIPSECCIEETIQCELIANSSAFATCRVHHGVILFENFLDSCKRDICIYGDDKPSLKIALCRITESLAKSCQMAGTVVNWRQSFNCSMYNK